LPRSPIKDLGDDAEVVKCWIGIYPAFFLEKLYE